MSDRDLEEGWRLALAQADGLARRGATGDAVARALVVFTATTQALTRVASTDEADRAMILSYLDRSSSELKRLRKLHEAARARIEERSIEHRAREQRALASPFGPGRHPPPERQ